MDLGIKSRLQGWHIIGRPIDIPGDRSGFPIPYGKEQEWIYGEGIASSRGGLTVMLSVLSALKKKRILNKKKIGVFFYSDEGRGMRYSSHALQMAAKEAKQVVVLQSGFMDGKVVDQRRGSKNYNVIVEGDPLRVGKRSKQLDVLSYFIQKAEKLKERSNMDKKLTVAVQDVHSERYSVLLPHRVRATIYMTYLDESLAQEVEKKIKTIFKSNIQGMRTYVVSVAVRPPLLRKKTNTLIQQLSVISKERNIPFGTESSLLASASGEIPVDIPVVCGFGPASKGLYTPDEALHRGELIHRSLLLALYLLEQ